MTRTDELIQPPEAQRPARAAPEPKPGLAPKLSSDEHRHSSIANVGLSLLFVLARRAPWLLKLIRPIAIQLAVWFGGDTVQNVGANGRVIFGRPLSRHEARRFARRVIANFYDFVIDVGAGANRSPSQFRQRIARTEGAIRYFAMRQERRGAILITAHMGSFEVGLAALCENETNVHVVFKRDAFGGFERIRARVRQTLGVREAPIDDGFQTLMRLRDGLRDDNAVVVMQGDRAMPGQRAQAMRFCSGSLRLPVGPVKLAQLTGSPIVPVFVVREPGEPRGFVIHLGEPIDLADAEIDADEAMARIAKAIESFVVKYPEQWLVLDKAFVDPA